MRALGRDEQIGENPPWRHVLAVVIGNGLEFYDFIVFAFFATEIGRQFFPSEKPFGSLLAALATFGIGFVFRPLGALAFGWLGDKVGRKPAMIASFVTMTTAMLVMALTPPAAQWGLAAQIVFVGARIVQGFALGGEVGPSTASADGNRAAGKAGSLYFVAGVEPEYFGRAWRRGGGGSQPRARPRAARKFRLAHRLSHRRGGAAFGLLAAARAAGNPARRARARRAAAS